MEYVFGLLYAVLVGSVTGWYFYNACAGSKKDRLRAGIIAGIGFGIISALAAFGG